MTKPSVKPSRSCSRSDVLGAQGTDGAEECRTGPLEPRGRVQGSLCNQAIMLITDGARRL